MTDCLRIEQLNRTDFRISPENLRRFLQETACYIFLWLLISLPCPNKNIFSYKVRKLCSQHELSNFSEIQQDVVEL